MGKLHTLRRAVERNPEIWFEYTTLWARSKRKKKLDPYEYKWKRVKSACQPHGEKRRDWEPWNCYRNNYRGFVKKTLFDLGYTDLV